MYVKKLSRASCLFKPYEQLPVDKFQSWGSSKTLASGPGTTEERIAKH